MRTNIKKSLAAVFVILFFLCGIGAVFMYRNVSAGGNENIENVLMEEGASVRYKEQEEEDRSGIRFSAYISEEFKSENPSAEYGMLMIPSTLLGAEEELTAETENAADKVTEVWLANSDKEGYDKFSTVLYDIPESAYGTVIAARAYIKNGENYIYSETTQYRSIAQVASGLIAKGAERGEELLSYVDGALKPENGGHFEVTQTEISLYEGQSMTPEMTVVPAELVATYKSDNEEVVSVSETGTITAVASGNTDVTVTIGSSVKTISVTVYNTADPLLVASDLDFSGLIPYDQDNFSTGNRIVSKAVTVILSENFSGTYKITVQEMTSGLAETSALYFKLTDEPLATPPTDPTEEGFAVFEQGTVLLAEGMTAKTYYLNIILSSDDISDIGKNVSFILGIQSV